jgi:hypothetical protein
MRFEPHFRPVAVAFPAALAALAPAAPIAPAMPVGAKHSREPQPSETQGARETR